MLTLNIIKIGYITVYLWDHLIGCHFYAEGVISEISQKYPNPYGYCHKSNISSNTKNGVGSFNSNQVYNVSAHYSSWAFSVRSNLIGSRHYETSEIVYTGEYGYYFKTSISNITFIYMMILYNMSFSYNDTARKSFSVSVRSLP